MKPETFTTLEKWYGGTGEWMAYKDFATPEEALDYANDRTIFYPDKDGIPFRFRIVTTTEYTIDMGRF